MQQDLLATWSYSVMCTIVGVAWMIMVIRVMIASTAFPILALFGIRNQAATYACMFAGASVRMVVYATLFVGTIRLAEYCTPGDCWLITAALQFFACVSLLLDPAAKNWPPVIEPSIRILGCPKHRPAELLTPQQ